MKGPLDEVHVVFLIKIMGSAQYGFGVGRTTVLLDIYTVLIPIFLNT